MIFWKPNGSLDIATDPSDLPAEKVEKNTISFAMQRCKNLRLDNMGVVTCRPGLQQINVTEMDGTPEYIFTNRGYRYVFTDDGDVVIVYRDEVVITGGVCVVPTISPSTGLYSTPQTVTMTTTTPGSTIYYTLDGTDPDETDLAYSGPIIIQLFTALRAITIRTGFSNSPVATAYYSSSDGEIATETDNDSVITETDSDNVINEGVD